MKENSSDKASGFFREMFGVSPTLEELEANFPHKEGCSRLQPLKQIEKDNMETIPGQSGWAGLPMIRVRRKYLECDECHVQEKFSE